jgi:hypothetical protein
MSSTTASFRVRRVHGREDMRVLTRTDGEMRYKYPPYLSISRLLYHPHPHFQITKNRRGLGPCLFLPSLPLKVYERASHVVLPRVRIQVHTSQPTMSGSALLSNFNCLPRMVFCSVPESEITGVNEPCAVIFNHVSKTTKKCTAALSCVVLLSPVLKYA